MQRMTRRARGSRAARVVVLLAGLTLLAAGWGSVDAHADSARDEIASKWNQFRAVAVAQGIAYQYTSTGDSLASGAKERWGGAVAGSLPYSYAMTSESRGAGIASVFWPGFVASHYSDALPILADTVPVVGLHTPDNVVDVIKTVAGASPAYPFVASTSGAKASEYTAAPPTPVPGGSVSGVAMRCDPEAASVHCSGRLAKAQLGGGSASSGVEAALRAAGARLTTTRVAPVPYGDNPPAAAVTAEGIDTTADAVLTEHEVRSVSTVNVASLDVLGSIHLGNIRAAATNIANGTTSQAKRTVTVGEAMVAGQGVTIDNQGVTLAGNPAMKQADYNKANTQLRDALSAAGITIRLFGGAQAKEGDGGTNDEGEALYIGLRLPEYGVPDSFFYLNYWVGGTLNGAAGVPIDTTASSSDDSSGSATTVPSTPPDRNGATPAAFRVDASRPGPFGLAAGGTERADSWSFPPLAEPAVSPASEVTTPAGTDGAAPSVMTMQAVRANGGAPSRHQGIFVGLLGLWQVLGLAVIAAVGRARVLARQRA